MSINPSEGFDDWRSFLIGTLEPGGEYSSFLKDTIKFINQIVEYNSLLPPNTSYTESFLTETLACVISKIMNFSNVSLTEKSALIKFLKSAQALIPWSALNDRIDLFNSFLKLVDNKTPLYQLISKGKEIQELNEYFINHEFLTLISIRISQNPTIPVTFDHIFLFYKLLVNFPKISEIVQLNLFLRVNPIFAEMLQDFDFESGFQMFQYGQFLETLQNYLKSIESFIDESANVILTTSLKIGFSLLKTEAFDKQHLGASILTLFSSNKEQKVREIFFSFMKDKNLIADLMARDLHYEIFESLLPLFKLLISSKQTNKDNLVQILYATSKANKEQQEIFFNMIYDAIKSYNPKDSKLFFNKISPLKDQNKIKENVQNEFESISIIFIKFSVLTLLKQKNIPFELTETIINHIVENASIIQNQNEAIEIVQQLCQKNVPKEIKYPLLKKCKSKFEKSYSPFLVSILTKLFNLNDDNLNEFNSDFFNVLQHHLLGSNDKSFLYELLGKLLHSQHRKIDNEMMASILKDSNNDLLWNFLSQVIDNDGKNAFETDSFNTLQNFINEFKNTNNQNFLEFLQRIMKILNVEAGNLKEQKSPSSSKSKNKSKNVEQSKLILVKTPLVFEQKLINSENIKGKLFSTVKTILIDLIKNCDPPSLSILHLLDIYNEKEKSVNLNDYNDKFQIYRTLRIIKTFCNQSENIDKNRILPHGLKLSNESIIMPIIFKVNILADAEKLSFDVKVRSDVSIVFLILQISPNLLYSLDRYNILLNGKEIYCTNTVQNSLNSKVINISLLKDTNKDFSTSPVYILLKKKFTQKLLNLIVKIPFDSENDIDNKLIKLILSLLDMLPSDEELSISSSDPKNFLPILKNSGNPYQILYLLQILNWRLFSDKYFQLYKRDNILLNTLITMCNKNPSYFSKSSDELLQIFSRINVLNNAESVVTMLRIIALKDLKDDNKRDYVRYLVKMKVNLSEIFALNADLLGDVIENINENKFDTLWPYISKAKDFKSIFKMSFAKLKMKTTKNISFFTKIFFHYLPQITTNDVAKQLDSCVQSLIDSSKIIDQSPSGIIDAIKTLVDNNINKLSSASNIMNKLFILIKSGYSNDEQQKLYNICCSLSDISQENKVALISFIDSFSNLTIEKWNILSDENVSNKKHKGLRNLGQTCYMNSVLQQFNNIYAFNYLLTNSQSDNESVKLLQKLFCSLSMTKRSYCDTKQFFDCWSKSHTHMSPYEQHDATEFMQFFLDDMPKAIESLYTGKIVNFIESADHSFKTQIEESFISLPIPIDKCNSVEESLKSILNPQKLFGNNQYCKPDGSKIDAESYQMIKTAPPILIIQLARFKINQTTKMREKINSRFEIADKINISDILLTQDNGNYSSYSLHGVVVHRGDGNHGHYISYIKNESKWLRFDDMEVSEKDETTYENESFGSDFPSNELNNMSGYLLFYTADGSMIDNIPLLSDDKIDYPEEMSKEVYKDNDFYLTEKSAFTTPTFEFILEEANSVQLYNFYFRVFCHFSSKGKIVDSFEEKINTLVISQKEENENFIEWLIKNINLIISIFINCNSADIIKSVYNIITKSIANSSVEKGGKLVNLFVLHLHNCLDAWRQVLNISNVIISYLEIRKENVQFAINEKWPESLANFVMKTYNGERQDYFLQNIDISPIFDSLDILIRVDLREVLSPLFTIHQQVSKSPSFKNYRKLIIDCASIGVFPIEDVVNIFPNELKDSKIMEIKFGKLSSDSKIEEIYNSLRAASISANKIINYISENKAMFKNYLILKQNWNCFYTLFLTDPSKIENYLFENLKNEHDQKILAPFFEFIRNKMEEISKKESIAIVLSFLRIVLFLMIKTNYPHDTNFDELKYFIKYQNKNEFLQISSYIGNPIILTLYDQKYPINDSKSKFKNIFMPPPKTENNISSKDLLEMIKIILSSSDKVVNQFLNKPNLCEVIKKSVSAISLDSDIDLIVKFVELIKNKSFPIVPHVIYSIISGNESNINYIIKVSKYVNDVIDSLNIQEVSGLLGVVDFILKYGKPNTEKDSALQFFVCAIYSYLKNDKIILNESELLLLKLNPDFVCNYLSDSSPVITMLIQLLTRMACLNINFRKDAEKVFKQKIFYSNKDDGVGYYARLFRFISYSLTKVKMKMILFAF